MQSLLSSNHLRERIVDCRDCDLGDRYCSELRARNIRLTVEYVPQDIVKLLILAESPPRSYKFIYDRYSGCPENSLAHRVFADLGHISSGETVDDERKEELLQKARTGGVLVLDCCHCAVNHLKGKRSGERNQKVASCFERHTSNLLRAIWEEDHPELWFKFPQKRGKGLLAKLENEYGTGIKRKPW